MNDILGRDYKTALTKANTVLNKLNPTKEEVKEAFKQNKDFEIVDIKHLGEWVSITARKRISTNFRRTSENLCRLNPTTLIKHLIPHSGHARWNYH